MNAAFIMISEHERRRIWPTATFLISVGKARNKSEDQSESYILCNETFDEDHRLQISKFHFFVLS